MNKTGYFLILFFRQCSPTYDKTITAASISISGSPIIFTIVSITLISALNGAGFNPERGKKGKFYGQAKKKVIYSASF